MLCPKKALMILECPLQQPLHYVFQTLLADYWWVVSGGQAAHLHRSYWTEKILIWETTQPFKTV